MISRLDTHYIDTQSQRQYSRIVGGIAWPTATAEGFLAVVGEDYFEDNALDARHLYLLAEAKAHDLAELARLYGEFSGTFKAGPWYGRLEKFYIHEMKELIPGFSLVPAPHCDDADSCFQYASLVLALMDPQRKILNLGQKNRLIRGFMNNTQPRDLTGKAEVKPVLAAIGYAVSQLTYFKPKKVASVSNEMAGTNYSGRW